MDILGIHHVSAITANVQKNAQFYTNVLGLRLVKKTVNQDDHKMYHLFYADEFGTPGTDMTFFGINMAGRTYPGTNSISRTSFRVPTDEAIDFWHKRLQEKDVQIGEIETVFSKKTFSFIDPEGQRLMLISDEENEGIPGGTPWERADIPIEYAIIGLGPSEFTVERPHATIALLESVFHFSQTEAVDHLKNRTQLYVGEGGNGGEVWIREKKGDKERPGRGSVHHVALRVRDEQTLAYFRDRLREERIGTTDIVERFYFKSLYFRDPNGLTIELATDGPGFTIDEPLESLGEALSLPPFIEDKREEIEKALQPISI